MDSQGPKRITTVRSTLISQQIVNENKVRFRSGKPIHFEFDLDERTMLSEALASVAICNGTEKSPKFDEILFFEYDQTTLKMNIVSWRNILHNNSRRTDSKGLLA